MELDLEVRQDTLLARLFGEIDLKVADPLRGSLDKALQENPVRHLILNLLNVSFIDSTGLGVILGRYKRVVAAGGHVSLVGMQPQVKRVMEISGILRIMNEYPTEDEAVAKTG